MSKTSVDQKLDKLLQENRELEARLGRIESRLGSLPSGDSQKETITTPELRHPAKQTISWRPLAWLTLRSVWSMAMTSLALLGGIATYTALRYDVSVAYLTSLNPKAPFESRFLVTNQGPFSIYDITYWCASAHVRLNPTAELTNVNIVPIPLGELRSRGTFSVRCQHPAGDAHIDPGAFLEIHVDYRPKFFPMRRLEGGQQFVLKYDADGNAQWLSTGWFTSNRHELEGESVNP